MTIETILKIALILIVIIFSVSFLNSKGKPLVDWIKNLVTPEEAVPNVPENIANKFYSITEDYKKCFNSKKDNCLCNIKILSFPKGHNLVYTKYIVQIVSGDNIFTGSFKQDKFDANKNVNCYIKYDDQLKIEIIKDASFLPLSIYDKKALIKKPKGSWDKFKHSLGGQQEGLEDYYEYPFLDNKFQFYKQGDNICFILKDEISSKHQEDIRKIEKC